MGAFGRDRTARPVVVAYGAPPVGKYADSTPDDLSVTALREALDVIGVPAGELEGLYLVAAGYARTSAPLRTQRLAERLGVETRATVEVECGGASALLAFKAACQDIALGHLDLAAVVGAQAERDLFATGIDEGDLDRVFLINAGMGPYIGPLGLAAVVPLYALCAQRYLHDHGIEPAAVAELSVRLRANAASNPRAELREPLSVDDVLGSRMVCPPIHKLEAAPWSDGAAAVVVCSEELARSRGWSGAALTGWGEAHDDANFIPFGRDLTKYPWIGAATEQALARAGRTRDELDVLEIYGAFAHAELMTYEAMGLCEPGDAANAIARGELANVNLSGGRLSLGHPPQATPLLELGEVFEQLTGRAGDRQAQGAQTGLVQAEHGLMNGAGVAILEAL
jgi:acetyl-CoA acetyltransferase